MSLTLILTVPIVAMGDFVKKTNSQCGVNLYLTAFCLMTITMFANNCFWKNNQSLLLYWPSLYMQEDPISVWTKLANIRCSSG